MLYQILGLAPGVGVETGGEFVEHRDLRAADQGQRYGQPLFLAAGELSVGRAALCREPEVLY